jgi:integrase
LKKLLQVKGRHAPANNKHGVHKFKLKVPGAIARIGTRVNQRASALHERAKESDKPVRRAATDAELDRFHKAALIGGTSEGLTGEQRYYLYRVADATGFRASELASL